MPSMPGVTQAPSEPMGWKLEIDEDTLHVWLRDGREVLVPLAWYPRLFGATAEQRANWQWLPDGVGIHWPDLDEDLSIAGFLGIPCT